MKNFIAKTLMSIAALTTAAGAHAVKVHTIGDSTMAPYDVTTTVTRGWGMYLQEFLSGVTVENHAHGGTSTRSFYQDSRFWSATKKELNSGDYVFIQFAHNDEKNSGMDGDSLKAYYTRIGDAASADATDTRGTVPNGAYKDYLIKYVNESRIAGCTPILVSPICRKYFTDNTIRRNGRHDLGDNFSVLTVDGVKTGMSVPENNHLMDYPYVMKQVADSLKVPFIDLTTATKELYEKYGDTECNTLFFDGNGSTHLNETGAIVVARLCAQKMKEIGILADNVNLNKELSVTPDAADLGSGYKGQTLCKKFTLKGFELTPESGNVTIKATDGLLVSVDQVNWAQSVSINFNAGMIISDFYVKYDVLTDSINNVSGSLAVIQGNNTISVPVTGTIVKMDAEKAQSGVTATWELGNGTSSLTSAGMSAEGLVSASSMSLGSDLTATTPQTVNGLSFYKFQPSTSGVSEDKDEDAVVFTIVPKKGLSYVPTRLALKAVRFGTNGGKVDIVAGVGSNTQTLVENFTPERNSVSPYYSNLTYDISNLVSTGEAVTIKIYLKGLANTKQYGIRDVVLTGNFTGEAVEVPSYSLNVSNEISAAGDVAVSPAGSVFDEGTEITLSATENFGYHFKGWEDTEGNIISERNPFTFNIDKNYTLKATWEKANVYNLDLSLTNGARKNLVTVEPEGRVVGNVHQYETGTEVKISAQNNKILTFTGWEDNTTAAERTITMDADKTIIANYSAADYIVGWDFYDDDPKTERAADYKSDSENAGLLSLRDDAGNIYSWLSRGSVNGQERGKYAARIWRPLTEKDYFEIIFSSKGYHHVKVSSALGNDYNTYTTYYEQASLDGKNYVNIGSFSLPNRGWTDTQEFLLPDSFSNQEKVYVRWYPNFSSEMTAVASDKDGLSISDIFVTADTDATSDTDAPVLVSSNPEKGGTDVTANGSIVLNFDEKVMSGKGSAMLNGETLEPIISGKTVVYKYSGLKYASEYTFTVPSGAITDRNGNIFEGTEIGFTTMKRTQPQARLYDAVVAADGTGNYKTIQEAIDAAPQSAAKPYLIFIKKGTYTGHVTIPATKSFIHLIGQGRNFVTVADNRTSGANQYGINDGATMDVESDNNYFEGFDLINSWGTEQNAGPQALALASNGDKLVMNKMGLRSYQDTWYTGGTTDHRAYIACSWIEGAVDFFYGKGDIMITEDTINIVRKSGGYIVAPNHTADTKWGYVFLNNVITAPGTPSETSVWLGRPWHENPKTVFINTKAEVTIPATGWYPVMGGLPALWAEYNTMDSEGNPVDLSHRRTDYYYLNGTDTIWGKSETAVLSAAQAAQYTVKNVCGGDDVWSPEAIAEECDAPQVVRSGSILSWKAVPYAICYVITDSTDVIGFTTDTTYSVSGSGEYKVQSVSENGGLSGYGIAMTSTGIDNSRQDFRTQGNNCSDNSYSLSGQRVTPSYRGIVVRKGKKYVVK